MTKEEIKLIVPYELDEDKINEILSLETYPLTGRSLNLTGAQFERLTAIARGPTAIYPSGKRINQWWCICNCPEHNIVLVRSNNLTSGNSKSCGCLNIEKTTERIVEIGHSMAVDITGQTFGELTALYPTDERKNNSVVWMCRCSCGKLHKAPAKELRRFNVCSCGHSTESNGVKQITKLLEENNIKFIKEKTFPDCRFNGKYSARFDFYIDDSYLIEFDGIQHFKETNFFGETLEERQIRDQYKNNWCKEHNILLIRIPYTHTWDLTLEDLLPGSQYTYKG